MGKAQFLLKEAGAVPQFSIKQDHVLNIIFSQLKLLLRPSARTHLHADLILCSEIPKYTKKKVKIWPFSHRIESVQWQRHSNIGMRVW